MANTFRVWIEVEELDEYGEHVENHDPGFSGTGPDFDKLEEAIWFATGIHTMATR